jgi:YD repeat-containing protein
MRKINVDEIEFEYDTELRLTQVTNPQGLSWSYTYDPAGRLVASRFGRAFAEFAGEDFDGPQGRVSGIVALAFSVVEREP